VLALRGGADLVALWGQLSSVMELVAHVALAGVGTGLAVYAAKSTQREHQLELLKEALRAGLTVSLIAALVMAAAALLAGDALTGGKLSAGLLVAAATAGCVSVIPGTVNLLWQGMQRRDLVLALALLTAALPVGMALASPAPATLWLLVVAHALPALVLFAFPLRGVARTRQPITRYVLPGVSIGVLTPASMLVARAAVGDALSWHDVGVVQALWRVGDWIGGFAGGLWAIYFLPQVAAAQGTERFHALLRTAMRVTVIPSAAVLALCFIAHRPLLAWLYDASFQAPDAAALLFFAGSVARVASWIPLLGLYVLHRTRTIAAGELLSVPLFAALLVAAGERLTLELAGAFWLASYCVYLAFNYWALVRLIPVGADAHLHDQRDIQRRD